MPGTGALLLLAFASTVVVVLLVVLQLTRLGFVVRSTIPDRPRRRMFIASLSFLITFVGVRVLVRLIVHGQGPFNWVVVRGHHIHHLVWGIMILLLVGYGWLLDLGRAHSPLSIFLSRLMSIGYGVGAALTLDEFAIWLNLDPNDYWSREGRLSIDAVILFGSILAVGAWGAPFFRGLNKLWDKRFRAERGVREEPAVEVGRSTRRGRSLRRRRFRRQPPHSAD